MPNRIVKRVVPAVVISGLVVVTASSAAHAEITRSGYYSVSYANTLFEYYRSGSTGFHYTLTYEDWVGAGRPTPIRASSSVVKYPWSSTLYAVTFFKGDWEWERLSAAEWQRMGYKKATNAGWIVGSDITKYASSPELILQGEDKSLHKLTYNQWKATGSRPYRDDDLGFVTYSGSDDIYLAYNYGTPDEVVNEFTRLTYREWFNYGQPTPARR